MGADFAVDLPALDSAVAGITALLDEFRTQPVRDIDCDPAAFGHHRLARTVRDFCDRWQHGLHHLTGDGAQIAEHLAHTVRTYRNAETAATGALLDAASGLAGELPVEAGPGAPGREAR